MSIEVNVSIVALVVSLVALCVALLQLLAALVSTADGYRKCMPATLGPWSTLRRRIFVWTELRFEVQFMTPHIAIIPATEADREQQEVYVGPAWFLTPSRYEHHTKQSIVLSRFTSTLASLALYVLPLFGLFAMPSISQMEQALHETLNLTLEEHRPVARSGHQAPREIASVSDRQDSPEDIEKQHGKNASKTSRAPTPPKRTVPKQNRELLVSWLRLLQSLNGTYSSLSDQVDPSRGADVDDAVDAGTQQSWDNFQRRKQRLATNVTLKIDRFKASKVAENGLLTGRASSKPVHTHVMVAMRYWTWDSMPADLQKPLATSTLNNVILMGLRLNMQWRKLDLENSLFVADGNGYSLSSFELRGMGIGFRFAITGYPTVNRLCVPSEAADKMMFGIIPGGDIPIVMRDYAMVTNGAVDYEDFLIQLGFRDAGLRKEMVHNFDEPRNEMISLLCPFLPLRTSDTFCNLFPSWLSWATSCFHFWEGRIALLLHLRRQTTITSRGAIYHATIKHVLEEFEDLEQNYQPDFYNRWRPLKYDGVDFETSWLEGKSTDARKRLIDKLRNVHEWTSRYFNGYEETDLDWSEAGETGRTCYVDLVAAHGTMSYHAVHAALAVSNARRNERPITDDLKRHLGVNMATRGFASHQFALAEEYVRRLVDHEHGLVTFYRQRRWARSDEEIEAAWWVLMLRGIVWDMSTQGSPGAAGRAPRWDGPPVSSALYNMETPVWIV